MPDGVARRVEKVEGAIREVVEGAEVANFECVVEDNFAQVAVTIIASVDVVYCSRCHLRKVRIQKNCIGIRGIPWQEALFESITNHYIYILWVLIWCSSVVPVPVRPDHGLEIFQRHARFGHDLVDVFINLQASHMQTETLFNEGWEILKVFSGTAVKEDFLVQCGVFDEKGYVCQVQDFVAG